MALLTVVTPGGEKVNLTFTPPMKLDDALAELKLSVPHPCGGRGVCGKCAVELSGEVSEESDAEKKAGTRLSCKTVLLGDACVTLPNEGEMEQIQLSGGIRNESSKRTDSLIDAERRYGIAVDIGTTTLALSLCELNSGEIAAEEAMVNPQTAVAADVIGRIEAAMKGRLSSLEEMITSAICGMAEKALRSVSDGKNPPENIKNMEKIVLTGNTTMLYLLTGRDPEPLSHAPFIADTLFGYCADIKAGDVTVKAYLPHCMNAFVGADITCAVLASGMCERDEISLLCDIGTNGEIALWKDGTLYVTSTAAGPAFEGAGISCGCGSVRGAVDGVSVENGEVVVHTIGDIPPVGVCGSGLIDLIAALYQTEVIDETGAMDDDYILGGDVCLEPRDVRAVQLAKAAIAAGIDTMFSAAGITPDEVKCLYIAGGFGSHLHISSAVAIGLIPEELEDKVKVIGNGSLSGAKEILLDENMKKRSAEIASNSVHVDLGGNPMFNDSYVEHMFFPI